MKSRWSHPRGAVVAAAALLLAVVGCTRTGGPFRTTTTMGGGSPTTMNHGNEHGMPMGGQYDHPPTQEQLTQLHKLVDQTRAYAKAHWPTLAQVTADAKLHFVGIGDGVHYTSKTCREDKTANGQPKPHIDATHFGPGYDTFDWTCPESLVMRGGTVAAVMYQLPDNMGMNDIPDMGGNYTMWHNHPLCFQSNNPDMDGYYRIGGAQIGGGNTCTGGYFRGVSPMIHVWVVPNQCGPFAGTVRSEGSCISDAGW